MSWCRQRLAAALGAMSIAAIVGCGATTHFGTRGSYASLVAYSNCMRTHGVSGFPDPSPGGGFDLPATINPQSPAYRSADSTCSRFEPGPIARREPSERQKLLAVAFSRCVRGHGIAGFPDPSLSVPPPGTAQGIIRGGMYWALAAGTVQSPAFRTAAADCGLRIGAGVKSIG